MEKPKPMLDVPAFSVTVRTESASMREPDDCDWQVSIEVDGRGCRLKGVEHPFAKRKPRRFLFCVPREWAYGVMQELRTIRIPAVPEFRKGCDGEYIELWSGGCKGKAHYRWWSATPYGWQSLDALAHRILLVFDLLRENYNVKNDRRIERLLMECPVVGMGHVDGIRHKLEKVEFGTRLILERDYDNAHDPNAVSVLTEDEERIGYIPRNRNQELLGSFAGEMKLFPAVTYLGWRNKHSPAMTVAVIQDRLDPEDIPIIPIDG